jgi:hypothetical protein
LLVLAPEIAPERKYNLSAQGCQSFFYSKGSFIFQVFRMTKASIFTLLLTAGLTNAAPLALKPKAAKAASTYDLPSSYNNYGAYDGASSYGCK